MSLLPMPEMKALRLVLFLSSLESTDHKYGPMYLIECFPYFTVQNLGIIIIIISISKLICHSIFFKHIPFVGWCQFMFNFVH